MSVLSLRLSQSLLTRLYRLQAIAGPYYQYTAVETCQVLSAPKEIDPRAVAWKGASVLGRLEASSEFWVTQAEWVSHFQRLVIPVAHAVFRTYWECVLSVTGHFSCSFHCSNRFACQRRCLGDSVVLNRLSKAHEASSAGLAFLTEPPHLVWISLRLLSKLPFRQFYRHPKAHIRGPSRSLSDGHKSPLQAAFSSILDSRPCAERPQRQILPL